MTQRNKMPGNISNPIVVSLLVSLYLCAIAALGFVISEGAMHPGLGIPLMLIGCGHAAGCIISERRSRARWRERRAARFSAQWL